MLNFIRRQFQIYFTPVAAYVFGESGYKKVDPINYCKKKIFKTQPSKEEIAAENLNHLKCLEEQENERLRRDRERSEKIKESWKKSRQHKKSKKRSKTYSRSCHQNEIPETQDPDSLIFYNLNLEDNNSSRDVFDVSAKDISTTKNKEMSDMLSQSEINSQQNIPCGRRQSTNGSEKKKKLNTDQHENYQISDFKKGLIKDPFDMKGKSSSFKKASSLSLKIYRKLIEKYEILLVCKSCLVVVQKPSRPCQYEIFDDQNHKCSKDHLAVREKKSPTKGWSLIRNTNLKFKVLCHQFTIGKLCSLDYSCPYPHSDGEMDIWLKYSIKDKLAKFISDFSNSDLKMRIELMERHYRFPGFFRTFCAMCFVENNSKYESKKRHVPCCKAGHPWTKMLFYETSSGMLEVHKTNSDCDHDHCSLFRSLLQMGFQEGDVVLTSQGIEKSLLAKNKKQAKKISYNFRHEETNDEEFYYCKPPISLEEAYDDEKSFASVVGFPYQKVEESFYDETKDQDNYPELPECEYYYEIYSDEELKKLLRLNGEVFKRCRFDLKTIHNAVCNFLDVDGTAKLTSVEVRGRKNCGPCFDGDEVVVELKDTKEKGDNDTLVKRGTVVGILGHAFNRREYCFLCKMDPYVNHLMIPVNGVGPKIHVLRETNTYNYWNMVFIYECTNDGINLKKSCHLSFEEKEATLFVVKYLKWEFAHMYPLGYVCSILKAGNTIEDTQKILNITYQIPLNYDLDICIDKDELDNKLTPEEEDLTHLFTISIDPENCKNIDDALSVIPGAKGSFTVVVHIADVSRYVLPGDRCDIEASKRMKSHNPATGPVRSMLPRPLSEKRFSLLQGRRRWALSVYFKFDASGRIEANEESVIKETLIVNKNQLSYRQAQMILDADDQPGDRLQLTLRVLSMSSKNLRKQRLKMGWMFNESKEPFGVYNFSDAHQLVDEFMILTNMVMAKFVVVKFPLAVPLRSQPEPNKERERAWVEEWSYLAGGSVYFDSFFETTPYEEMCSLAFLKNTMTELESCMDKQVDVKRAIHLIGNEVKHPIHAIARLAWHSIQEKSFFVCSGDTDVDEKLHYSLKTPFYTQFSSPIRRYIDLIVHRLVKAALRNAACPYSTEDIMKICNKANILYAESRKYKREVNLTKLIKHFSTPLYVPVFVSCVQQDLTEFASPFLPKSKFRYRHIKHNQLALSDKPDVSKTSSEELRLMWDKMIFDANESVFKQPYARKSADEEMSIDPKRHVFEVEMHVWRDFLIALSDGSPDDVRAKWEMVRDSWGFLSQYQMGTSEVTSEMRNDSTMVRPHVKFSLDLKKGSVIAVQVGVGRIDGYLRPQVKMINLTDQLDICLVHKRDPVACFSSPTNNFTREQYVSTGDYQKIWFPLLSMEAATAAAKSGNPFLCHSVQVRLWKENESYYGRIQMSNLFCKKRKIYLKTKESDGQEVGEFLCIRFPLRQVAEEAHPHKSFIPNKWVCHAVVFHVEGGTGKQSAKFKVQQMECHPPGELLQAKSLHLCTIEFLSKPQSEKKMCEAMEKLPEGSQLCKAIALKHSLDHLKDIPNIPAYDRTFTFDIQMSSGSVFYKNNENQTEAIRRSLTQPFTLIQGPPGTGKTLTAIKIAWWFARFNREGCTREKVVYCGPSNSSVNVATEWLKRMNDQCPKIIRVFGKTFEQQWYPTPRCHSWFQLRKQSDALSGPDSEDTVDLHHLIRKPGKPYAQEICRYDDLFRKHFDYPEKIEDKVIDKYESLLNKASKEEIKNYDIVLCTCATSSTLKMKKSNFAQLIIDECGMCREPESLIPLVNFDSVRQVVLLGDHMQLQPIVMNRTASELGLKKSLFERYKGDAFMLDCQYRMHPAICEFPSKMFYEGKLKTFARKTTPRPSRRKFWPRDNEPVLFCHVEGAEKSGVVATAEDNEASKSNLIEALEVVRIYREFQGAFPRALICILSQYGAQCNLIDTQLVESGGHECKISTVVSSQGNEYDYVILSLVRSMPEYEMEKNPSIGWCKKNLGFITDEHQINVALTRAKHGLVIVGNKYLLRCSELFKKLLKDWESRECVVNSVDFAPSGNRFNQL